MQNMSNCICHHYLIIPKSTVLLSAHAPVRSCHRITDDVSVPFKCVVTTSAIQWYTGKKVIDVNICMQGRNHREKQGHEYWIVSTIVHLVFF